MTLFESLGAIENAIKAFFHHNLSQIDNDLSKLHVVPSCYSPVVIQPNTWGVYSFHVEFQNPPNNMAELAKYWRKKSDGTNLTCPKLVQMKRSTTFNSTQKHCLYVGKSHDISSRVNQHIKHVTAQSTYSLKLSQQEVFNEQFSPIYFYSYFPLVKMPKESFMALEAILVNMETVFRNRLQPLIGKQ